MQSAEFAIAVFEFALLIFSLSVHECSHAWVASRLGDQTARMQGRVTLNPIYHIDPVGTLIMPAIIIFGPLIGFTIFSGVLIGWAKPTPVISRNFQKIRRDENLVTLAGPVSNLILAIVATVILLVVIHAVPGGRHIVNFTLQRHCSCRALIHRCKPSFCLASQRFRSTSRCWSSTCCPFRRSTAATCYATSFLTTPCRLTTAFPSGSVGC